jgi:endonuclease YncB( thermonuclease family)
VTRPVPPAFLGASPGRRAAQIALVLVLLAVSPAVAGDRFTGKVIRIADGDTIEVLRDRQPVTVRLNGIDAPETGQAFGTRARQFVGSLAFGQVVTVVAHGTDRYGRTIGDVGLADGRVLNREVVRAGFAWWFRRYSTDAGLGELEAEARDAKRGLWVDPHPVPPWEWRQAKRSPPPPPTSPIIGNRGSRIYHRSDCPNYGDVSPRNRVPFATASDAEAAGYRLAKNCP